MRPRLLVPAMILALAGPVACSKQPGPERSEAEAYAEARSAFAEAETPEAAAAIAEKYLSEFPDGEHAPSFAWVVVEYRGRRLGEREQAFATVMEAMEATADPARRLDLVTTLFPLARELGRPLDLRAAVAALQEERPLAFDENQTVMELAAEAEDWDLVLERAEAALAQATPEAVRAEHPDREMEDERVARRADQRASVALAHRAWALFNTGRAEEAEEVFAEAFERTPRNYVGLPTSPAALFWGRASLERGDAGRAMELLAPLAIMGNDPEAMSALETAWQAVNGSMDGFREYLDTTRKSLARPVDDFTLADYEGTEHTLSEEFGKVTFLAFWFPT